MTRQHKSASILRTGIAGVVVALMLLVTACGSDSSADDGSGPPFSTIKDGTLVLAFQDGGFPRIAKGEDETLIGTFGYIITKFAAEHDLKLELMATDTRGQILAVQSKRADMGSAIYNKPDRRTVVHFLDYDTYDSFYVAYPRTVDYTGPETLDGKTVGVASGFSVIPHLEKHFGADNVKQFKTYALGVEALRNGQIDGYFNTLPLLGLIGGDDPELTTSRLNPGDFGIPADTVATPEGPVVACGNDELAEAYNSFYREIVQTEEYEQVWKDAWTEVGAADPLETMVSKQLEVPNDC